MSTSNSSSLSSPNTSVSKRTDDSFDEEMLNDLSIQTSERRTLIVRNLPQILTDKSFLQLFIPYGAIRNSKTIRQEKTDESYGYGYVEYYREEDTTRALGCANEKLLDNKQIKISITDPSSDENLYPQLLIKNLAKSTTEKDLIKWFQPFGELIQTNIFLPKDDKVPRLTAFARFERRDEALEAINTMHKTIPQGTKRTIEVKLSQEYTKEMAKK